MRVKEAARFWIALLGIPAATACNHTAPFVTEASGAVGPFRDLGGEEQLTTVSAKAPEWTADGGGVLLIGGRCIMPPSVASDLRSQAPLPALWVVPKVGGSASWELCERRYGIVANTDSSVIFGAAAVDTHGAMIMLEAIGRTNFPPPHSWPFPVDWHAELWLSDTGAPFTSRRRLLTLYHDRVGTPVVSPTTVNWIAQASWAGPDTFVAVGQNLNPNGTFTTLGVYRGVIVDSATLTGPLPGTGGKAHFGFANGGHTVVFSDSASLHLWEESFDAPGAPSVIATLPDTTDRSIVDVSCGGARCVVISTELVPAIPGTKAHMGATLWELDVATGALTIRWSFTGLPPLAALPTAVAVSVVVVQGRQLYLLQGVLPD